VHPSCGPWRWTAGASPGLPQTLVEEDLGQGRLVAAASSDWNVPLEIRLYCDNDLLGKAANAFWSTAIGE